MENKGKDLKIIITTGLQNDFVERLDDIKPIMGDNLKLSYGDVASKWMEYFLSQNRQVNEANVKQFISWLKNNPPSQSPNIPMSYHRILDKYGHRVHIDYEETQRLWEGDKLSQFLRDLMRKAAESNENENSGLEYQCIHLRDWHDPTDESQVGEMNIFGQHAIKGTYGAKFASPLDQLIQEYHQFNVILNNNSLSSFADTPLAEIIDTLIKNAGSSKKEVKIGIFGVISNVKVFLFAYELMVIHNFKNVYVCKDFSGGFNHEGYLRGNDDMANILGASVVDHVKFREVFNI